MYEKFFYKAIGNYLKEKYEIVFSEDPDFLFYSVYGSGVEHYKYKNCIKIFYGAEGVLPDFNECDYAIGSYPMSVNERYHITPYCLPKPSDRRNPVDLSEKKFCNFIYSNENNGKGAILRKEFCECLMEYKKVDCPGKVLHNIDLDLEPRGGKNWYESKLDFIKNYKFTIAFENASMPGMTSEKLLQPLMVGSVPIYWGDPYVDKIYNQNAYINCNDCSTIEEMVKKVVEIDNNDTKYMEMLTTKSFPDDFYENESEKINEFLEYIINYGKIYEKNPLSMDKREVAGLAYLKYQATPTYKIKRLLNKLKY